jgi:hypothetical protein
LLPFNELLNSGLKRPARILSIRGMANLPEHAEVISEKKFSFGAGIALRFGIQSHASPSRQK